MTAAGAKRAVEPEPWWAVLDSSTEGGEDPTVILLEALVAFAMLVDVAGLRGDGQLLTELEDVRREKGWEGHTKVLSGTNKERNQWVFLVVKGILGQRYYESDYWPDLVPIYWL